MEILLEYLPVGIIVFQAEEPYQIQYTNKMFERILGRMSRNVLMFLS